MTTYELYPILAGYLLPIAALVVYHFRYRKMKKEKNAGICNLIRECTVLEHKLERVQIEKRALEQIITAAINGGNMPHPTANHKRKHTAGKPGIADMLACNGTNHKGGRPVSTACENDITDRK